VKKTAVATLSTTAATTPKLPADQLLLKAHANDINKSKMLERQDLSCFHILISFKPEAAPWRVPSLRRRSKRWAPRARSGIWQWIQALFLTRTA